ncbi:peroxidase 43-like [Impatiens glandulifera]|uniref:peroxidase 43-like n=1 Tax=Impatiens glandulifera TaxID=253017 RepID=UPI001FB16CB3|nr:peroxidase 43-like [Impatiens glandulifera]
MFGFTKAQLRVGFYSKSCPRAESIVSSVIREATQTEPRIPALMLRLHFHDCFVEGCDGSILIDNVADPEREAFGHQGLGGFVEVEKAKQQLEVACPGVVSCADIVALAARDAVVLSKGPFYAVQTGRRDGLVSSKALASEMPDADESIQVLKSKFRAKGLTDKDLVLLSAAHTIGTTACFFITSRLYSFGGRADQSDPAINRNFLFQLKSQCPNNGDVNHRIPLDRTTGQIFDDQILRNIRDGFAVIGSDARLNDDIATKAILNMYVGGRGISKAKASFFAKEFAAAMVKMGQIGVKTGFNGEIRRKCNSFN